MFETNRVTFLLVGRGSMLGEVVFCYKKRCIYGYVKSQMRNEGVIHFQRDLCLESLGKSN